MFSENLHINKVNQSKQRTFLCAINTHFQWVALQFPGCSFKFFPTGSYRPAAITCMQLLSRINQMHRMFKIVKARYFTQICKHLDKSRNCAQNQDREKKCTQFNSMNFCNILHQKQLKKTLKCFFYRILTSDYSLCFGESMVHVYTTVQDFNNGWINIYKYQSACTQTLTCFNRVNQQIL